MFTETNDFGGPQNISDSLDNFYDLRYTSSYKRRKQMADIINIWGEDKEYPRSAWKYDVANDATNLGYWEWVEHQKEMNGENK